MALAVAFVASAYASGAAAQEDATGFRLPGYTDAAGNMLTPTLAIDTAFFLQGNSWYGRSEENLGKESGSYWEGSIMPGLDGALSLGGAGQLYGRVSLRATFTAGFDAAGSIFPDDGAQDVAWEDAYAGWRSGDLFAASLGTDAIDLSAGRQTYEVGDGFLFWDESFDGARRAALWTAPRTAANFAGIAHLQAGSFSADAVVLSPDGPPHSELWLAGANVEYAAGDYGTLGAGYWNIFDSNDPTRDGMQIFDIRADLTPLEALRGLRLAGELAYEVNGDVLDAFGTYGEIGYTFDRLPGSPYLSYRYAYFSGDDPATETSEAFDPLFYANSDWGIWIQGEILGEWVLSNSNLVSHTVRLRATPFDWLTLNLLYYDFSLADPAGVGVSSADFAQEIDLIADIAATENLSFSVVGAVSIPGAGAEEMTGGSGEWTYLMGYAHVEF